MPIKAGVLAGFIRIVLGLVFILAAWAKITDASTFYVGLLTYELPLPDLVLRLVATLLPWIELACGLMLWANLWADTIRPMVTFLCAVFVAMLAQAAIRGLDIDCSCFGAGPLAWLERKEIALPRALILLAASGYLSGTWSAAGRRCAAWIRQRVDQRVPTP